MPVRELATAHQGKYVGNQPSQAMIRNSSSSVILCSVISGFAVMIWSSAETLAFFLYSKSPKARAKERLPNKHNH